MRSRVSSSGPGSPSCLEGTERRASSAWSEYGECIISESEQRNGNYRRALPNARRITGRPDDICHLRLTSRAGSERFDRITADLSRIMAIGTRLRFFYRKGGVQPGKLSRISPISARRAFVTHQAAMGVFAGGAGDDALAGSAAAASASWRRHFTYRRYARCGRRPGRSRQAEVLTPAGV